VNVAAYLVGSTLIGFLNDRLGAGQNPVMMALYIAHLSAFLPAERVLFVVW
jgi:hypothetical protein